LEELFPYIPARDRGNRPLKTLYEVGIRRKSCDVWCFMTPYVDVDYGFPVAWSKYLEYISSIRIMHNNNNRK
jgi:hypothetical protein